MGHTIIVMTDEELDSIFQPQSQQQQQDATDPARQADVGNHVPAENATLVDERWLHMLVARRAICGGDYEWAVRHQGIPVSQFLELTDGWEIDRATKKLVRTQG
jgi:hypothetical protein